TEAVGPEQGFAGLDPRRLGFLDPAVAEVVLLDEEVGHPADPFRCLAGAPARHGSPALGLIHADRDASRDTGVIALSRPRPEAPWQLEPRRDGRDSVAVGAGLPAG